MRISILGVVLLFAAANLAQADAVSDELKNLQGTWKCVYTEENGKKLTEEQRGSNELGLVLREMIVKDSTLTFKIYSVKEKKTEELKSPAKFSLDVAAKPKQVTWSLLDEKSKIKSSYSLEGDTLKVALFVDGSAEKKAPASFETKPGDKVYVYVFQRVK